MAGQLSIRTRLIIHSVATSVIVLLLVTAGHLFQEYEMLEANLRVQVTALARATAANATAPLVFQDPDATREMLGALKSDVPIHAAVIFDKDGKKFSTLTKGQDIDHPALSLTEAGVRSEGGRLMVVEPVVVDGEHMGSVYIVAKRVQLKSQVRRQLYIAGLVALVALLIAFVLSTTLHKQLSTGLTALTEAARRVSTDQDYAVRVDFKGTDEVGIMVDAFNSMLEVIENRNQELAAAEAQLRMAHKLEAVGQLAAGVAHEINTPVQYITDNTTYLKRGFEEMMKVFDALGPLVEGGPPSGVDAGQMAVVTELMQGRKMTQLLKEVPDAIDQSLEGLDRVASIVRSMGEFAHPGSGEKAMVDINRLIESTVNLSRNEWKYVADVNTALEPDLPNVLCNRDDIGQTVLNILVNAAHAIGSAAEDGKKGRGTITVSSRSLEGWIEVEIRDDGPGIPAEIQARIFDPFFTTKEVGKGTGQGLALAYKYIVNKHMGSLSLHSEPGQGATFSIRIPHAVGGGA